jgi:hypothetical protein
MTITNTPSMISVNDVRRFRLFPLALLAIVFSLSLISPPLAAHPISICSAIVDVREKEIIVEMEVMLEDLVLYHSLTADGEMKYSQKDLLAAAEKHRKFLLDYFSILDGEGNRLVGTIAKVDFDQIQDGVHQSELMTKFATYSLQYPVEQSKPKFLTFLQNFGGKSSALPAVVEVNVLHRDRLENSFQLAIGRPTTQAFDWDRVYENKRPSFEELKKKRKDQFQATLGISSYSGLYSFLYVSRFEVRHEILIPLITLEKWIPIERKDADFLDVEEQTQAKQAIEEFFAKHCVANINGETVSGKLTRLSFFSLDIADFALNADPRRVSVHQARVGVIWTFPSRQTPRTVKLDWTAYSDYAPFLNSVVLIGNDAPTRYFFHSMQQSYEWTGDLIGPQVEPVTTESFSFQESDRKQALEQLLRNTYRAFDFREDEDVYDALATSVKGDLLREVYLRIKRSLLMAEQGGALSHATQVVVSQVEPNAKSRGREFDVTWQVTSVSEHWGHIHTQTSEYKATIAIGRDVNTWKMESFQLLSDKKIKFETSIRGNDPSSKP